MTQKELAEITRPIIVNSSLDHSLQPDLRTKAETRLGIHTAREISRHRAQSRSSQVRTQEQADRPRVLIVAPPAEASRAINYAGYYNNKEGTYISSTAYATLLHTFCIYHLACFKAAVFSSKRHLCPSC